MLRSIFFFMTIALSLNILSPGIVHARWATAEDAGWELAFHRVEIEVDSDGSYIETIEIRKRILKESSRAGLAIARETYNSNISRFKVLEAKTINDGREVDVDSDMIEDKPLASSPQGFDRLNQVLIAFPEVRVGSQLYYKYRIKNKEPTVPNFFSSDFVFGWDGVFQTHGNVHISSEIPLFFSKNDPDDALEITQKTEDGRTEIDIEQKKTIFKRAVDEASVSLPLKKYPWVTVASAKNWGEVAGQLIPSYEKILAQPLPEAFERVLENAKTKGSLVDRLNTVTSGVNSFVNYMGDWKTISGRYIPRDLDQVAESRLGDCKDFSAVTVAILRRLGIQSHIALVKRGVNAMEKPTDLPSLYDFNHAMVYAEIDDRKYWIDPTNFVSFSQGVFSDIANRKAWVLKDAGPFMGQIGLPLMNEERVDYQVDVHFLDENRTLSDAKLSLGGSAAIPMTGARLKASKQTVDFNLVSFFSDREQLIDWEVKPYDLTSRVVQDLDFQFQFTEKNMERKTSMGPGFDLGGGSRAVSLFMTKVEGRVSDIFFGVPMTWKKKVTLNQVKRIGREELGCSLKSAWMNVARHVSSKNQQVFLVDEVSVLKSHISNEELQSQEFIQFQERLSRCFKTVSVLYRRLKQGTEISRVLAGKKNPSLE